MSSLHFHVPCPCITHIEMGGLFALLCRWKLARIGTRLIRPPPPFRRIERTPHVVDKPIRTDRPENSARGSHWNARIADAGREKEANHHTSEPKVREPDMRDSEFSAVNWMAEEPWQDLVADAEDHHDDKADEVHMGV